MIYEFTQKVEYENNEEHITGIEKMADHKLIYVSNKMALFTAH